MKWFERVAKSRKPDFIVGGADDPYLERWWIIPRNSWFNIYLHRFLRSDEDRALHDHPYVNLSVLLQGSYTEETISAGSVHHKSIYVAGQWKFRRAVSAHRVELHDGPCWTLFLTGPRIRDWGFHCPGGWRPWQVFVSRSDKGQIGIGCD